MSKNLFNVGALFVGFATTLRHAFMKKPTIEYPSVKKQHAPRFRYDRLMAFGWKVLLPVATLNLILTAVAVAVWPTHV